MKFETIVETYELKELLRLRRVLRQKSTLIEIETR